MEVKNNIEKTQVIMFTQNTMQTLSEYKKQFQELFNVDLIQTEI